MQRLVPTFALLLAVIVAHAASAADLVKLKSKEIIGFDKIDFQTDFTDAPKGADVDRSKEILGNLLAAEGMIATIEAIPPADPKSASRILSVTVRNGTLPTVLQSLEFGHGEATWKQYVYKFNREPKADVKAWIAYENTVGALVVAQDPIAQDPKVRKKIISQKAGNTLVIKVELSEGNTPFAKDLEAKE